MKKKIDRAGSILHDKIIRFAHLIKYRGFIDQYLALNYEREEERQIGRRRYKEIDR